MILLRVTRVLKLFSFYFYLSMFLKRYMSCCVLTEFQFIMLHRNLTVFVIKNRIQPNRVGIPDKAVDKELVEEKHYKSSFCQAPSSLG